MTYDHTYEIGATGVRTLAHVAPGNHFGGTPMGEPVRANAGDRIVVTSAYLAQQTAPMMRTPSIVAIDPGSMAAELTTAIAELKAAGYSEYNPAIIDLRAALAAL